MRGAMKTTLSWLKTHLDTPATIEEIVERLVMLGHDVDGVDDPARRSPGSQSARVVSAVQHPNADRLQGLRRRCRRRAKSRWCAAHPMPGPA